MCPLLSRPFSALTATSKTSAQSFEELYGASERVGKKNKTIFQEKFSSGKIVLGVK
jgi:hypothetical protein